MTGFNNEWIRFIHCLLWRVREIDEWVLHSVLYELSRENVIDIDNWVWFGEWPRSSIVDAIIALLTMSGAIKRNDGVIIVRKNPTYECVLESRVEEVLSRVLNKYSCRVT